MTANLVKLMSCRDAIQAETIRNRLETAGIRAVVQGAEVGTALSYVGVAIGYPNIEVGADDLRRARDLLDADRVSLETAGAWNCSRCGEFNEPAFEVCWSCNKTRSDEDLPASVDPEGNESGKPSIRSTEIFTTTSGNRSYRDGNNPYQPLDFTNQESASHNDEMGAKIDQKENEAIDRAFIAAVFGGFLPIMIFTIYSLSILVPLSFKRYPATYTRPKRFYGAWAINLLVTGVFFAMLLG
ncbi:MAG TPA: hypothetical protein DDZ51_02720 [Planctomycetaceae bacterium]|nr:hypothetical protein [Planctomycetaceae bacterium]